MKLKFAPVAAKETLPLLTFIASSFQRLEIEGDGCMARPGAKCCTFFLLLLSLTNEIGAGDGDPTIRTCMDGSMS